MKPLEPAQRIRPSHTYLMVWTVHRALALGAGGVILLMSLTGGVLVMHHDIERLLDPRIHRVNVPANAERVPLAPLVRAVAAEAPPGYRALRHMPAQRPGETEKLMFVGPDGRTRWSALINPYNGEILWRGLDQSLFTPWLLNLHMHLHLGGWGYVVTGLAGLGLLLLGLTGLYIHRGGLATLWRWPLRMDRGWRVALGDFHRWIGLVTLYFSLVLGLTGAIYAATIAPGQIAAPKPPTSAFELRNLAPIEPALQRARERFPGGEIVRISFPTSPKGPLTVLVLHRDAPVWRKFSRIEFEPATGAVLAVRDARAATPREKFSAMLSPLHFGFYGSRAIQWLYALGGFGPAILMVSGVSIWLLRCRRKGRPVALNSQPAAASERVT